MERTHDLVTGYVREKDDESRRRPQPPAKSSASDRLCDVFGLMQTVGWVAAEVRPHHVTFTAEEWLAERLRQAALMLKEVVEVNHQKKSCVPVIRGTRITLAQVLA